MKGKKCCGVLLLLFITLGLSLSVSSGDSKALMYEVNTIPIYKYGVQTVSPNFYQGVKGFYMRASNDFDASKLRKQPILSFYDNNGTCVLRQNGYHDIPHYGYDANSNIMIYWGFNGSNIFRQAGSEPIPDRCLTIDPLTNYNTDGLSSLVPADIYTDVRNMLPYRFQYDGFYSSDIDTDNGLHKATKFDISDLWYFDGDYPNEIKELYIPLGPTSVPVIDSLSEGDTIEFEGEFILEQDDYESSFALDASTSIILESHKIAYYLGSDTLFTSYCDWHSSPFYDETDSEHLYPLYSLKYSCSTTVPALDYNGSPYYFMQFGLQINLRYTTSNTKLHQFIFDSSVSITNNDRTPGGAFNKGISGSNISQAPGSAKLNPLPDGGFDIVENGVNWTQSLINLFKFNFINPFSPIFEMFSDQSACASIPQLASMMGSTESTICPWFPSSVRNVLTPVFGISSTMLVFGLVVRWLNSHSGNMFSDSQENK